MATINSDTVLAFNEGGVLEFTSSDGTTYDNIMNFVKGSLRKSGGHKTRVYRTDRGVQQPPISGEDTLAEFTFEVFTGAYESGKLYSVLTAAAPSGNTVGRVTNFKIKIPEKRGATAGKQLLFAECWLKENPVWESGAADGPDRLDKLTFTFESPSDWVPSAYA